MINIKAVSWAPGVQVVSLIELVRQSNKTGLLEAKRSVEAFLNGSELIVLAADDEEVRQLRDRLLKLGVTCELTGSGSHPDA